MTSYQGRRTLWLGHPNAVMASGKLALIAPNKMNRHQRRAKIAERRGKNIILDRRDPHAFDGSCVFCGKYKELRPYGPNNENICFDCAMKDEATTACKYREFLDSQA